jgi:hypothetical protein
MNRARILLNQAFSSAFLAATAFGSPATSMSDGGADPPEALRKALDARFALFTGEVAATRSFVGPTGLSRTVSLTGRFCGETALMVDLGDSDGVVVRDTAGNPASTSSQTPRQYLRYGRFQWIKEVGKSVAEAFPVEGARGAPDYRVLGLLPWVPRAPLEDVLGSDFYDRDKISSYEESREGSLQVVTARLRNGDVQRWYIDPARGWSVTKSQYLAGGRDVQMECTTEVAEFDGYWYPTRIQYTRNGASAPKDIYDQYEVTKAEFNRPQHPRDITPETIGIVPGETPVQGHSVRDGALAFGPAGFFDGQGFVSADEFLERQRAARAANPQPPVPGQPPGAAKPEAASGKEMRTHFVPESEWEAYTRKFIETHKLDEGQQNAALAILKDCQERGRSYVDSRRERFEQLEKDKAGLAKLASEERAKRAAALERRERDLRRPVDQIFERQLKPRLEKLLTAKQREATRGKGQ